MYKVSVPIMNSVAKRSDRERLVKEIKRFRAERIFLALDTYETDNGRREAVLGELRDNCDFFKAHGFEVGAWVWTLWVKNNTRFRSMRSVRGKDIPKFMCPTDETFVDFAADYISDIAKCGVSLILLDDDFRYGFLSDSPACLCDRHIEIINGITGVESTRAELEGYITSGGANKFRDAYLKANGDAFRNLARAMRAAVDRVDPSIRLGCCACMSSWDIDGTSTYELAKILAGSTRPLARLIGAPYWAVNKSWGNTLADTVELERMESAWTRCGDVELLAEGDAYPRPRINCPASYLEGFDTAIRASECTDGILKYGIDYTSNADYETGYARFQERNEALYGEIDRAFGNKTSSGIRVYESMNKVASMETPTRVNDTADIESLFFSGAARMLACCSIPTVYEGEGVCGIVFDENARNLPRSALKNGTILDIAAAEILSSRGIDVGLEAINGVFGDSTGSIVSGAEEHFLCDGNFVSIMGARPYDISVNGGALILSDMQCEERTVPLSYRYENADGERFLVLNVNARRDRSSMLRHYARGRQIADSTLWLSGKRLPAYVYGSPYLYLQCKRGDGGTSVGLWNFFADIAMTPVVELGEAYEKIRFINCNGRLEGDRVYLDDIPPFAFAGFELFKA